MIRLALLLLLAGCTTAQERAAPVEIAGEAAAPGLAERIAQVVAPRRCAELKREWLQTQPKAEGVVAEAVELAEARGKQVDRLNAQLARITRALKHYGCAENPQ